MARAFNPSTPEAEAGGSPEASLVYRVPGQSGLQTLSGKTEPQLKEKKLTVVAHTFNPSTWEAEAGRFLSSRPAWSTK